MSDRKVDIFLLVVIILLILFGFLTFLSASLGLLAKDDAIYTKIITNQLFIGLLGGLILMYTTSRIPYKFWKIQSFWIFFGGVILTGLVFTGLGSDLSTGTDRWLKIGSFTFQPAELLKFAYLFYLAAWLSLAIKKGKIKTFKYGTLPFLIITGITAIILALQPDNDTMAIIILSGLVMYFVAGANFKHLFLVFIIGILLLLAVLKISPYVLDRIETYLNPSLNPHTTGYQIQQSLIAIGSGGLGGRGFGQSIQKFNFLPEPVGDSIFAVMAEEFGFIGSMFLIVLFILLLIQGIRISLLVNDDFGGLLMIGIVILIVSQSFLNIGSMLGVFPLSGLPLLFVSHGGTALLSTLAASGIMLNISRFKK